ncbi:MAG TPA: NAD(P)H-dependent glycerol-3-phosphate dehydrogenase [Gammaproteobacteria bacterium]|nr:NAD(P)H-dependent glycerol-3-phosphate dehydrogenase [Gammaproteobacteria bacterium]
MALRVAVLGAGSWGTALAILLARNGHAVTLWGRDGATMAAMAKSRRNGRYLPDAQIPDSVQTTASLADALAEADMVLVVVPSRAFRGTLEQVARARPGPIELVWGTKGFDPESGDLLHQVAGAIQPQDSKLSVLSGPTFAGEIAAQLPAAVTIASADSDFAARMATAFHNSRFRVYSSEDVVGVQTAGAVKNVLAVAAGIADGLGFGANTRAALITRGLAEIVRLGVALGGRMETFMGLAGLGDLVLTCTDNQSRNRRFGLALARGLGVEEAVVSVGQVVEGAETTRQAMAAGERLGIELPIVEQVYRVIYDKRPPLAAVSALLARPPSQEGA